MGRAVEAADGPAQSVDFNDVNLAAHLSDEDHWHIPDVGEATPTSSEQVATVQSINKAAKIDINTASTELLESLPGIGELKARDIVKYRDANGPFADVDGLLDIRGIGSALLESIRDLIEVS